MTANLISDGITCSEVFKIRWVLTLPLVWQVSDSHVRHLPHLHRSIYKCLDLRQGCRRHRQVFLTQKTATAQLQVFLFRFEQNDTWSVISFFSYNSTVVLFMGFLYIFIQKKFQKIRENSEKYKINRRKNEIKKQLEASNYLQNCLQKPFFGG